MLKTYVAMFKDPANARRAVYDLGQNGYDLEQASVVMRERYESSFSPGGSLLGGGVIPNQATTTPMDDHRTTVPGIAPATAEDAPGFGPLVAAGLVAQGLGGAALGKAAGGVAGGLSDVGIPNDLARELVDRVRFGNETLVSFRIEEKDGGSVETLFVENGASVVYRSADKATAYYEGDRAVKAAQAGF